jgi:hypothetical protein
MKLEQTLVNVVPVSHIDDLWLEEPIKIQSPLFNLYSQLAMGELTDEASQIFSNHQSFGLHEKYYRDMGEL